MPRSHRALLQHPGSRGWHCYERPVEVWEAHTHEEVAPLLAAVETAASRGLTAAGFLTYEAAHAFDPSLVTRPAGSLPLAWFAAFEGRRQLEIGASPTQSEPPGLAWEPSVDLARYRQDIEQIREWIATGDTYQVNHTLRLQAPFAGDAGQLFEQLLAHDDSRYGALIDIGDHALCSLSPELFFRLDGDHITTRPMKGTAERGRTTREDEAIAADLQASVKNRAENIMIVDMMRNDLGRVARPGSVEVSKLWEIERYRTLFQLTSTCEASTDASVTEILTALFPSASITGAPKVRTMQLIAELESSPRGIYTGAIGRVGPGRSACFNVAIRTVHIDRKLGRAEYGTGGGIVWDSAADEEYRECRTKALVVTAPPPEFSLFETLRWDPVSGFVLLQRHLGRLGDSARYFDLPFDRQAVEIRLSQSVANHSSPLRVRLLLDRRGIVEIESTPLERGPRGLRLALASGPVDPSDPFLFHKTTQRIVYDRARQERPDVDDVLLWNPAGEITESTVANVVIRRNGVLVTPPVASGLLAGTLRADLLVRGRIHEEVIRTDELQEAEAIYLINSVRGWMPARLIERPETLLIGHT